MYKDLTALKFPGSFYEHLVQHTLTGIKGGTEHNSFLDIWMVNVDGRIFVRSWGKSNKSWFTALLKEGIGQIKYGDNIIGIKGVKCTDATLNKKIDEAYKARYITPENLPYVAGITKAEYLHYTIELIFMNDKYACPCCGYKTFESKPDGTHTICPVCFWEDDLFQLLNPNYEGGANWISLKEAQKNFMEFGACEREMIKNVRKPNPDEARDADWKPIDN